MLLRTDHQPMISVMSQSRQVLGKPRSERLIRRAAIIAIGSEMLGAEKLDTNSLVVTALLERFGVSLVEKVVVGDNEADIAASLRRLVAAVDVVVVTGGLGPTRDDCTRAAAAEAFGRTVRVEPALVEEIRRRFAAFGREMPAVNQRQAEVIEGAEVLSNPRGTAPGQRIDTGGGTVFLFPGVPRELVAMVSAQLEPWLSAHAGDAHREILRSVMKVACIPESLVEERLAPFYRRWGHAALAVLARPGDVRLELRLVSHKGAAEDSANHDLTCDARAELALMKDDLRAALGDSIYGEGADASLESVVVGALREGGKTLAVAESCTGGLLASRITRVAGASVVFLGGAITYANALKETQLGVPKEMMVEHGAVSEPVARQMAHGVCRRFGADFGLGITGIAGPGGGTDDKPVGMVHVALAAANDPTVAGTRIRVEHRCVRFPGDREMVRWQATQMALELLRRALRQPSAVPGEQAVEVLEEND